MPLMEDLLLGLARRVHRGCQAAKCETLLPAAVRPPGEICAIRLLWSHRESLVQMAAEDIMQYAKALSEMNLELYRVLKPDHRPERIKAACLDQRATR